MAFAVCVYMAVVLIFSMAVHRFVASLKLATLAVLPIVFGELAILVLDQFLGGSPNILILTISVLLAALAVLMVREAVSALKTRTPTPVTTS